MEKTERYNYVFDQYDGDIFIYDSQEDERIDDLSQCADILNKYEAKLAEKEKYTYTGKEVGKIEQNYESQLEDLKQSYDNLFDSYVDAKKQLNEKEKEDTKRMEDFEKRCQEYYSTDEYKRDFAIAELEKVLYFMRQKDSMGFSPSFKRIKEQIREQIKTMKGE